MIELHGYYLEDLQVGMAGHYGKTITEADILLFSGVSGDTNPLHLNREFAATTQFGECIAHGMLTASLISTVIGTRLPGPGCIYLSQTLKFLAPVRPGDTVMACATVEELMPERARARLRTTCVIGERLVLDGEALIKVPRKQTP